MNLKNLINAAGSNRLVKITIVVLAVCHCGAALAQTTKSPYPRMAPIQEYLMDRSAEITLARSAAPPSISGKAEVMVLTQHGYETAVKGTNGFVCAVERSWFAGTDDPDFWNPKVRGPICFNSAAARSQRPILIKRTEFVLASASKDRILQGIKAAFEKKELVEPLPGSMCYMLSREGYLGDDVGRWRPHLMFFVPLTEAAEWGGNLPGSPILGVKDVPDRTTVFLIPVGRWSDGSSAPPR